MSAITDATANDKWAVSAPRAFDFPAGSSTAPQRPLILVPILSKRSGPNFGYTGFEVGYFEDMNLSHHGTLSAARSSHRLGRDRASRPQLLLAAIEAGKCHPGAATSAIVLDQ